MCDNSCVVGGGAHYRVVELFELADWYSVVSFGEASKCVDSFATFCVGKCRMLFEREL